MTDHTATWRSSTSGETGQPQSGGSRSVQGLAEQTREQALQAGDYLARNVQEYPFGALLIAGLVGEWIPDPRRVVTGMAEPA